MALTPRELVDELISLFPGFEEDWDDGEGYGYESGDFTYHVVVMEFATVCHSLFQAAGPNSVERFANLVNHLVEEGGSAANAIDTCFLEHASQVGVRKEIWPFLSRTARSLVR